MLLCLLAVPLARADEPAAKPVAANRAEIDARLHELEDDFDALRRPQRAYFHGWIWGLTAIAAAQTTLAVLEDEDRAQRTIYVMGASLSLLGIGVTAILQSRTLKASFAYRGARQRGASKTDQLALAEALMGQHVLAVQRTRSWYMHVLAAGLGLGVTLGLGFAFDDIWKDAVIAGAGAVIGVELRVWTHPSRGLKLAKRYESHWPNAQLVPLASRDALGLGVRSVF